MKRSGPKMFPHGTPTDMGTELDSVLPMDDERKGRTQTNLGSCYPSQQILIHTTE